MIKSDDEIFRLNGKLREKETSIKELTMQIEELEFTVSNIRLDFQATVEETTKKETMLKKQVIELKEQI